ncbi:MAG: NlpC/P60 family protein [Nitrospirota bacterium]
MKKKFLFILVVCILSFPSLVFSAQESVAGTFGIVSSPLANVRQEPAPKSSIQTQVLLGDEVRILGKENNRYRISIPSQEQREGWVQQEAVIIPKDKGKNYLNPKRQWVIITKPRSEALILDKTGDHKVSLYAGTRLPVVQKNPGAYTVQFPDRSLAILDAADTMPVKTGDPILNETKPEDLAKTAKQFINVRYFEGGLTAQGMDMQGLLYITCRIHGITGIGDLASGKAGEARVSKKDLQPGDILAFYGEGRGMYIGNGQFLQTAKKRSLRIAGIYDRPFSKAFQYGIRLINAGPDEKKKPADMTADEIYLAQMRAGSLPLGKRIAYWAKRFIGTPYDTDPVGLYVRTNRIVADEKADCMYHTFRAVELALTRTPREAVERALTLRFITNGILVDGRVVNYDERFQYGEDMVMSKKWGANITADLGPTVSIAGSRNIADATILPKESLAKRELQQNLQDGDIIFWVKDPKKRIVEEIVGHISIIRIKSDKPYLIHASGSKGSGSRRGKGMVKELSLSDYLKQTKFIGAFVTRFKQ